MMDVSNLDTTRKPYNAPFYSKDLSEYGQIHIIEFSQHDWSQDIILIAFQSEILLGYLKFGESLEVEIITKFPHPFRCSALTISPDTTLNVLPNIVMFCAAGCDYKLRVYKTDLDDESTLKILSGHSSYINDVKFDPENNYLISVSDDNSAKVWEVETFSLVTTLYLTSPGIAADWHKSDNTKFVVAEKIGLIRIYSAESMRPIISLSIGKALSSCHWSPFNSNLISSLHLGELVLWNLKEPSLPKSTNLVFTEVGGMVKFSPQGELIAALNSLEGSLKIINTNTCQQRFTTSVTLPSNLAWHYRLPIICLGDDSKLCFWKVNSL